MGLFRRLSEAASLDDSFQQGPLFERRLVHD